MLLMGFQSSGLTPALDLIELKANLAPRRTGKFAKIVQCGASELDYLHSSIIQYFVWSAIPLEASCP